MGTRTDVHGIPSRCIGQVIGIERTGLNKLVGYAVLATVLHTVGIGIEINRTLYGAGIVDSVHDHDIDVAHAAADLHTVAVLVGQYHHDSLLNHIGSEGCHAGSGVEIDRGGRADEILVRIGRQVHERHPCTGDGRSEITGTDQRIDDAIAVHIRGGIGIYSRLVQTKDRNVLDVEIRETVGRIVQVVQAGLDESS